ncbi:helix-turn-helix transcriptional regulator [Desulfurivibrio sp. C05AmB]|uniref:helix-turn-helix transcriptional regulator n=1 Tax=Desulfurivibrio sp. C05AmB TaxID=3374371 RepID=UPI00376EB2A1
MPAKIHQAIARQWELLKLLPSRPPGKSARELAEKLTQEGFQVSKRTVERDLNELLIQFPIQCNDRGTPYGWYWSPDAHCDLPGLTLAEAMSTRLLEDFLKPLLPASILRALTPRFRLAERKLQAMADNRMSSWADKVRVVSPTLTLLPPKIDQEILATVQEALLEDEQLEIVYHSISREEANTQTIHPLGLVQRGPITYLVATAYDYDYAYIYALHRINAAHMTGVKCRRPKDFSLDKYIGSGALHFGDGEFIRLRASVSLSLAKLLQETPLAEDMIIKKRKKDCMLTCTIAHTWQLHWWILSQSDEIEILSPPKLRIAVIDAIQRMGKVY